MKRYRHLPTYLFLKRVFDVVVSLLLLVILCIPVLFIALIHKLRYGRGFFSHTRVGMNGKEFRMYKLSSMHVDADPYGQSPLESSDTRVTTLGKYLRRYGIDEIPQLWNVLKGDMSLVGPRPEMPFIVATYTEEDMKRLGARPGVTGWWQIQGLRPLRDHHEYDFWYIDNRSLLLDVYIICITPFAVCQGK